MSSFVHLHNHTEYSLLDGANRIPEMVARAKADGQTALAITDHGVMFGVMEFYFECMKQGIKPILGMEAYVAPNGRHVKTGREENQTYHLVLLAKNEIGYKNLCKLHTVAALEGFYYKPRIDHEILREHATGLIGTSSCLGSEICQFLLEGNYDEAQKRAGFYKDIFDEGSYFFELQDHGLKEQEFVKEGLLRIAKELKLPLIATNDAHYLCRESNQAHDVLLCIGTGALLNEPKRLKFETDEFYLKETAEMKALFHEHPEAIENTLMVQEMCQVELSKTKAPMPQPNVPGEFTSLEYLRHLAEKGLGDRLEKMDGAAQERLEYELGVIQETGFENYFLLVREFANYAREQGIAFGVRGSAAGSLVSYTIGITDVDPLHYGLTFERFLNPERISMPDIDMDFEDDRREEVIKYVVDRFGNEQVAQIITFGTLGARAAIKDTGRVMGYQPFETDKICKTIPNLPGMTIDRALSEAAEFRNLINQDPRAKHLVELAKDVEGLARHAGVHAAGVVISGDPLTDHIPLFRGNEGQTITAFEMGILEKIGLLKMDFLGLSNLTVLSKAVELIQQSNPGSEKLDWLDFPLDDEKTFNMLGRGDTVGVFQLESSGMRRYIVELKPQTVFEVSAMVALYRPGPMEHIPTFIECKNGRREITYIHELMEPILQETYGIIVYQDQVLQIVRALAGFSLGKADVLRRAMGKKDKQAMDETHQEFIEGCAANGVDKKAADKVWELLLPFAGYAFNKAHSVCYALLAYQTAYLKANYTVEYMAALLTAYQSKEDRVVAFVEECRKLDVIVSPPTVTDSQYDFCIENRNGKKTIRFGLAAIKGVGSGIIQAILKEREIAPFTHLYEFCERLRPYGLNRVALEAMVKAGALSPLDRNPARLYEHIDGGLVFADNMIKSKQAGQDSLFFSESASSPDSFNTVYPELPQIDKWSRTQTLAFEKDVMGVYLSDHPLKGLELDIEAQSTHTCAVIEELEDQSRIQIAGVIAGLRTSITKSKGEKMANIILEDFSGQCSVTIFPATYAKFQEQIRKDTVVKVSGVIMHSQRFSGVGEKRIEVRAEEIAPLEINQGSVETDDDDSFLGHVTINISRASRTQLESLREVIEASPGSFRLRLRIGTNGSTQVLTLMHPVDNSDEFVQKVKDSVFGCKVAVVEHTAYNVSREPAGAR